MTDFQDEFASDDEFRDADPPQKAFPGQTLSGINMEMGMMGIPSDYILHETNSIVDEIWKEIVHRCSQAEIEKWTMVVPEGTSVLKAGMAFQLKELGSVQQIEDLLILVGQEMIKYQITDWEIACVYNNRLPFKYRDGIPISRFYRRMQKEVRDRGGLKESTKISWFERLQFHMNDAAYKAFLDETANYDVAEFSKILYKYPRVQMLIPFGRHARGFAYSAKKIAEHLSLYGEILQTVVEVGAFCGKYIEKILDKNGLSSEGKEFAFFDTSDGPVKSGPEGQKSQSGQPSTSAAGGGGPPGGDPGKNPSGGRNPGDGGKNPPGGASRGPGGSGLPG